MMTLDPWLAWVFIFWIFMTAVLFIQSFSYLNAKLAMNIESKPEIKPNFQHFRNYKLEIPTEAKQTLI